MEICFLEDEVNVVKMAKRLLRNGAKLGLRDKKGRSAFSYACQLGREQLVTLLIDEAHTFDPNSSDNKGKTALHYTAISGNLTILKMLLKTFKKFKLSVDKTNERGETPLMCASKAGHFSCAKYLVEEGKASTQIRDNVEFKTAEEWKGAQHEVLTSTQSFSLTSLQHEGQFSKTFKRISTMSTKLNNCQDIRRPHTAPERLINGSSQAKKNYKKDLHCLFQIYEKHVSSAFLPGIKQKPVTTECCNTPTDLEVCNCNDGSSMLSSCSSSTKNTACPSLTMRKTAKIVLDGKELCRRRSNAVNQLEKPGVISSQKVNQRPSMNRRSKASSSRLLQSRSAKDGTTCQSARAIERITLSLERRKKNLESISNREEKEQLENKTDETKKIQKSLATEKCLKQQNLYESEDDDFLNNYNECDDDDDNDDYDDLMSLSSPAAL
jgi:hypothetical protein